ncbi:MAG: sugar transferase [Chloroflexi bacterium]|nr:sugar transferase [Chloroflexota bacterium]
MDVSICLITLPVTLLALAICCLAIRLDSPGPVIFDQDRVGKGGRRFRMYKLRTMRHNLDDSDHRAFMKGYVRGRIGSEPGTNGHHQALAKSFVHYPRNVLGSGKGLNKPLGASQVTRVGRVLRKASLDELPQIINVLKGEMSLVGPRPFVAWEIEECQPWHHERLEVLPGITGLAQIRGRSCISFDRLVRNDIEYIERRSLILDLEILLWTVFRVILNNGAG